MQSENPYSANHDCSRQILCFKENEAWRELRVLILFVSYTLEC